MVNIDEFRNEILVGDAREKLKELPKNSVDMAMTSPPYWGLRDYGVEDQIGLEETPEKYVENLMKIFSELKRVLKPTGTFYLNIDDTYSGLGRGAWDEGDEKAKESYNFNSGEAPVRINDLPDKCMSMVPERVAMALIQDGWILRNKIIWDKPNPMPESVKDRFSTGYEFVYMFSLQKDYYFDLDAVREPHKNSTKKRNEYPHSGGGPYAVQREREPGEFMNVRGKNPGDVWEISTKGFKDAHFAVYPKELTEKPIKAGCPQKVCAKCGSPYERDVEVEKEKDRDLLKSMGADSDLEYSGEGKDDPSGFAENPSDTKRSILESAKKKRVTKGWKKTCDCDTEDTKPGIVLDPFAGAGTTLLKAWELGRDYIGVELNEEYVEEIMGNRLEKTKSKRIREYF